MLAALLSSTFLLCLALSTGPSNFGDDLQYAFIAYGASHGQFVQLTTMPLYVRVLQVLPIALMFRIFGYGPVQGIIWDALSFIGTALLVFLIGKELYGERIALLAALLFILFPMVFVYSITMSDNPPMMLFAGLSAYLLLRAVRSGSWKWYLSAGASMLLAPLASPEGFVFWVFAGLFLAVECSRHKIRPNRASLQLITGFLAALCLLFAFNYATSHNPFITFTENWSYYGLFYKSSGIAMGTTQALGYYPSVMFPYNLTVLLGLLHGSPATQSNIHGFPFSLIVGSPYFYALVVAAAYLVYRRDKPSYFPLFWIAVVFAYLEFGPMHIGNGGGFSYVLSYRLDRYLLLAAPPMAIIIAAAAARFSGAPAHSSHNAHKLRPRRFAAALLLAALAMASIITILFFYNVLYAESYSEMQIGRYLNALNPQTQIYSDFSYANIAVYTHFENPERFHFSAGIASRNCTEVPAGAYVVLPRYNMSGMLAYNGTLSSFRPCGNLAIVLSPHQGASEAVQRIAMVSEVDLWVVQNNSKS